MVAILESHIDRREQIPINMANPFADALKPFPAWWRILSYRRYRKSQR